MLPEGWENVRRILAIRLDNVGDVIMLGPGPAHAEAGASRRAHHADGDAGRKPGRAAAALGGRRDGAPGALAGHLGHGPRIPDARLALVEPFRERGFDAALIFTSFSQSPYPPAYVCYLAGMPIRLASPGSSAARF